MWIAAFATFMAFDVVWSAMTTFRGMSFVSTYIFAALASFVFTLPSVLAPRRIWIQILVFAGLDMLLTANLMYFRTYFTAIPASSYLLAGNLADFKGSVLDSVRWPEAVFFVITIAAYVIARRYEARRVSLRSYLCAVVVSAVAAAVSALASGGLRTHIDKLSQQCYYANCPPVAYTVFGKIYADVMKSAEPLDDSDRAFVEEWFVEADSVWNGYYPPARTRIESIVVIFLESFESWPVGLKVEGREVTPVINSLLRDSTTFYAPRVLSQVGTGRSIDAQLLMLAGMYPTQNEVYAMSHADSRYHSLQEAFKNTHPRARSYLLTPDKPTVWNQIKVAQAFGVDTVLHYSSWDQSIAFGHPARMADESLFAQAAEKMRHGDVWPEGEKAFVHIVTYSGHNPFKVPEEMRKIHLKEQYPANLADYITDINYVDNALGKFVDYLRTRTDYDRTLVVIVGDHEGLGANRHSIASEVSYVPDAPEAYVPMIVLNSPVTGVYADVMGEIDVYSTILDLAGLYPSAPWRGMGMSIFDPRYPHAAITPSGEMLGQTSEGASATMKRARRASDLIIRHNLIHSLFDKNK